MSLKDYGIVERIKKIADGKGEHADDVRDIARTAYEQWVIRVQEIREERRWKMTLTEPLGFILERNCTFRAVGHS